MKKFLCITLAIIAAICLFMFVVIFIYSKDEVIASLGKYDDHVSYTAGEFQDCTDYAKYYYSSAPVADNKYLKKIRETDFDTINTHLDDFEGWIEAHKESDPSREIVVNYDFDRGIIDTEDYIYIDSEEHTWDDGYTRLVRYNIYFFDTQTQVLYYFHNNI